MDFRLRKGDTEDFHSHPAHVLYVLEPFRIRFSFPDGTTEITRWERVPEERGEQQADLGR